MKPKKLSNISILLKILSDGCCWNISCQDCPLQLIVLTKKGSTKKTHVCSIKHFEDEEYRNSLIKREAKKLLNKYPPVDIFEVSLLRLKG